MPRTMWTGHRLENRLDDSAGWLTGPGRAVDVELPEICQRRRLMTPSAAPLDLASLWTLSCDDVVQSGVTHWCAWCPRSLHTAEATGSGRFTPVSSRVAETLLVSRGGCITSALTGYVGGGGGGCGPGDCQQLSRTRSGHDGGGVNRSALSPASSASGCHRCERSCCRPVAYSTILRAGRSGRSAWPNGKRSAAAWPPASRAGRSRPGWASPIDGVAGADP
jgi:hypothetical protein